MRKKLTVEDGMGAFFVFFNQPAVCFSSIPGVSEEQATARRGPAEVQTEKDGDVSDAQQKDEERAAQSEPPDGVSASEDPGTWEIKPPVAPEIGHFAGTFVACQDSEEKYCGQSCFCFSPSKKHFNHCD